MDLLSFVVGLVQNLDTIPIPIPIPVDTAYSHGVLRTSEPLQLLGVAMKALHDVVVNGATIGHRYIEDLWRMLVPILTKQVEDPFVLAIFDEFVSMCNHVKYVSCGITITVSISFPISILIPIAFVIDVSGAVQCQYRSWRWFPS